MCEYVCVGGVIVNFCYHVYLNVCIIYKVVIKKYLILSYLNKEENLFPDEQREESLCCLVTQSSVHGLAGLIDTEAAWISFVLDQLIIEQR